MGKFNHRVGSKDVPHFGGVRRESDPGAIPPTMFRDAVNIRFKGGVPISRGGQEKRTANPLTGRIQGIFSSEYRFSEALVGGSGVYPDCIAFGGGLDVDGPRLYYVLGSIFIYFAENQYPLTRGQDYASGHQDYLMESFEDGVGWVGGDDGANFLLSRFARGSTPSVVASVGMPTGATYLCSIAAVGGDIYFACTGPPQFGSAAIYRYSSGVATIDEHPVGVGASVVAPQLGVLGDDLYYARGSTASDVPLIRRKSGGVWGTLTHPYSIWTPIDGPVVFNGELYYFGSTVEVGRKNIFKISGTTVTEVATPATVTPAFRPVVFNGYIYYFYGGAADHLYVGRFDGTTWTHTHKDITGQFAGVLASVNTKPSLVPFQGKLRANLKDNGGGCDTRVYSSPPVATDGDWVREQAFTVQLSPGGSSGFTNGAVM